MRYAGAVRALAVATSLVAMTAGTVVVHGPAASAGTGRVETVDSGCQPRLLVLSAFPAELGPLLARTHPREGRAVAVDGHTFYLGRLEGHRAVLGLTGIGPVNAGRTTRVALRHFRCHDRPAISAVVFSGVAGGDYIGDVNAPVRWTEDGKHFLRADPAMVRTARRVVRAHHYRLSRRNPLGDPLCACLDPDAVPTVTVTHRPRARVGGSGLTTDPFGGRALPCIPGAGDVFGCRPCEATSAAPKDTLTLVEQLAPFLDPGFFTGYFAAATPPGHYVSEDNETAAVATVAHRARLPFLGFRGVSDGKGDPLHLPGYPFQFFVYRQLAADNTAAVAAAFLRAWRPRR